MFSFITLYIYNIGLGNKDSSKVRTYIKMEDIYDRSGYTFAKFKWSFRPSPVWKDLYYNNSKNNIMPNRTFQNNPKSVLRNRKVSIKFHNWSCLYSSLINPFTILALTLSYRRYSPLKTVILNPIRSSPFPNSSHPLYPPLLNTRSWNLPSWNWT